MAIEIVAVDGVWLKKEFPASWQFNCDMIEACVAAALGLKVGLDTFQHPAHTVSPLCCGGDPSGGAFPSPQRITHRHFKVWISDPECPHDKCAEHGDWKKVPSFLSPNTIMPYIEKYVEGAFRTVGGWEVRSSTMSVVATTLTRGVCVLLVDMQRAGVKLEHIR